MARKFPEHPARPERICWGCDRYCPAEALACGNGSERTPHPVELFGDDWLAWSPAGVPQAGDATPGPGQTPGRSPETHE